MDEVRNSRIKIDVQLIVNSGPLIHGENEKFRNIISKMKNAQVYFSDRNSFALNCFKIIRMYQTGNEFCIELKYKKEVFSDYYDLNQFMSSCKQKETNTSIAM